ncbi:MAG: triose-phosphate isomerase [Deltaproteobacteria bacterium]|nr:triose-phosphate isomerase [Deltaproteobacteria bacterium]
MRRKIIAGNWKMHKTSSETGEFIGRLWDAMGRKEAHCEVIVAPPFTSIAAAVDATRGGAVKVSAQDVHWENQGAYTGEVSGAMVKDSGCSHVIVGHSERRQWFGETDESVNLKIKAALRHGLIPIFCLGESLEEREASKTFEVLERQVSRGLDGVQIASPDRLVIAYEPVWAIGTGRTASPEQAQEAHAFIRGGVGSLFGRELGGNVRILYGGSVKPENTRGLMSRGDIDGALVGGASLKIDDFMGIITESA